MCPIWCGHQCSLRTKLVSNQNTYTSCSGGPPWGTSQNKSGSIKFVFVFFFNSQLAVNYGSFVLCAFLLENLPPWTDHCIATHSDTEVFLSVDEWMVLSVATSPWHDTLVLPTSIVCFTPKLCSLLVMWKPQKSTLKSGEYIYMYNWLAINCKSTGHVGFSLIKASMPHCSYSNTLICSLPHNSRCLNEMIHSVTNDPKCCVGFKYWPLWVNMYLVDEKTVCVYILVLGRPGWVTSAVNVWGC